jgi:hypothetical protein
MALSKDLEIYKAADALLAFALRVQTQVPRAYRVAVGQKVCHECVEILLSVARGIEFVGHVLKPWRRTTRKRTLATAMERLRTMPAADTFTAGNSYLGLLRQASHSHHDRARVAQVLLRRGHAVKGDLSKIYRSHA